MMQRADRPKLFLDTSVLVAWLGDEQRPRNEMDGVSECFSRIERGEAIGVVSSAIWTELILDKQEVSKVQRLHMLLSGRRAQEVSIDKRVGRLSGEPRQHCIRQDEIDHLGTLTSVDAQHLAAAIHYNVGAFYTFDEGKKPNREDGGRSRSLLSISGDVAGYPMTICKPPVTAYRLDLRGTDGRERAQ